MQAERLFIRKGNSGLLLADEKFKELSCESDTPLSDTESGAECTKS